MACFIPPLLVGALLLLASRASSRRGLSDLSVMMLGGSILLAVKHALLGESLLPTASISALFSEVVIVGVPMVFAVVAVWLCLTLASRRLQLGESLSGALNNPGARALALALLGLAVMVVVDFAIAHLILGA
ncbi:MAG: hypothetical protein QXS85_03995 [Acidilobaceae archaeon]